MALAFVSRKEAQRSAPRRLTRGAAVGVEPAEIFGPQRGPEYQVFDTLIVGIFSDMSFAFSAILIATLRAIAL